MTLVRWWRLDLYVRWEKTPKVWMTICEWITNLRKDSKAQGCRVFLIMEKCSSHKYLEPDDDNTIIHTVIHVIKIIQVDNSWCIMLPPNRFAFMRPLDQGIILMVKARYTT